MSSSLKQHTDKDKASTNGNILSLGFLVFSSYIKTQCCNTMDNKRTVVIKSECKYERNE